jgi:DnaJ-domain-containing protein 1
MENSLGAKYNRRRGNGRTGRRRTGLREHPPSAHEETIPGKDYTPEILEFLRNAHGKVRIDNQGDYYYENVSTISLHFLLRSRLPAKEVLWRWYEHFERGRSETIYETLPPQRDEEFLEILSACSFAWDEEAVRQSGLVFLSQHRAEVYMGLEEFLSMRLDAFETMDDAQLADMLNPVGTWSDLHLRKLVRQVQTQPLPAEQRQAIYEELESDYLRATARHLLDEALNEAFWKSPPPELEALRSRFIIFARTMTNTARRLGVYSTRKAFEEEAFRAAGQEGASAGGNGRYGARPGNRNDRRAEHTHFAALGLEPTASLNEVKNAYRDRVKQHHPDQGGTVQDFLRLQEAYEYLLTEVF